VGGFSSEFGSSVHALALLDNIVYVGGVFTGIGVGARNGLAALDATTGTVTLWSPNPGPRTQDPRVGALRVNGDTLYVGGYFQMIGGAPRTNIAAVHLSTGTVSEWNPGADNQVAAVWPAGTTLFAGGTFETIGGQSRPRLAQLEVGNGSATAWNANPNSGVNALVADANTIYVGGDFSFIGGEPRMGFAAFGLAPPPRIETDSIQRLADGGLQFRVSGPSGVPLIVQGSIDFSEWVGLQTNTVGGVFDFTDGDALLPWQFYRALAQ